LECPKHDNDGEVKSFHPELAKASLGEGALFFKHRYEIEIIPVSKNNNFSTIATLDAPINLQHMSFKLFKKLGIGFSRHKYSILLVENN
jgi:hypothetical protein